MHGPRAVAPEAGGRGARRSAASDVTRSAPDGDAPRAAGPPSADRDLDGGAEPSGGSPTERRRVLRRRQGQVALASDLVTVEEPLEIRVNGRPLAVTMRTPAPGQDVELALGFLHGEGIASASEVTRIRECRAPEGDGGLVEVELGEELPAGGGWQRQFYATSSCGICGKASIEAVRVAADPLPDGPRVAADVLDSLPDALRSGQRVFERTGGLHAAAIFDAGGELLVLREDVGRHNAVDKVIGRALMRELVPLHDHVLLISGRASFEVAQKALLAGVPILAAVSAPSSLAVRLAEKGNMTLVGFLRPGGLNVYAGAERVDLD